MIPPDVVALPVLPLLLAAVLPAEDPGPVVAPPLVPAALVDEPPEPPEPPQAEIANPAAQTARMRIVSDMEPPQRRIDATPTVHCNSCRRV